MSDPANYPIVVRVGDTEVVNVTLQDAAGAALDITGRTYAAQIRETVDSASPLVSFTCAIVSAAAGTMSCTIAASVTAGLVSGVGVWDLQETNGAVVTTLLAGAVRIDADVTR